MKEIRIGIIGSGFMGRTNAETVTKYLDGAKLVSIAGGSRAAALAAEYNAQHDASPDSLLSRADIDAVFISTPHAVHAEHATLACKNRKHILLDKPMAASVEECTAIIEAGRHSGTNVMIMFGQRFRKVNIEARRLIAEGVIGRITQLHSYALNSGGLASLPAWQSQPENLGTLFGHGIHNLDQIRWFTGQEVKSVAAQVQREAPSNNEVASMVVLGLSEGTMATVWVSWTIPSPNFPNSAFSARIVGEKGILELDAYGTLRLGSEGKWTIVTEQAPIDFKGKGMLDPVRLEAYAAQGNEFLNSIREHRRPSVTGEDGRAAVQVALAAYESAARNQTILL